MIPPRTMRRVATVAAGSWSWVSLGRETRPTRGMETARRIMARFGCGAAGKPPGWRETPLRRCLEETRRRGGGWRGGRTGPTNDAGVRHNAGAQHNDELLHVMLGSDIALEYDII